MSAFSDDIESIHPASWKSSAASGEVKPSPDLPPPWSYETTVSEVEAIISSIETGDLELAEVFNQFAIAVEHLRSCETFLNQQKQRMDLLIEILTDEHPNA